MMSFTKIDAYLEGEMTALEQASFEAEITQDPALREAVHLARQHRHPRPQWEDFLHRLTQGTRSSPKLPTGNHDEDSHSESTNR